MEDMVMERKILYLLKDAANVREIRIVNGHQRGNIEKAINGEKVGTLIRA
jgi:molybdenum storage protein